MNKILFLYKIQLENELRNEKKFYYFSALL